MTEKKIRIRGPKGTSGASRIVVNVLGNPKTPVDPSHELWELYGTPFGAPVTLKDFVNAMHARGVRDKAHKLMTLDARRGYISVENYARNLIPFDNAWRTRGTPISPAALPTSGDLFADLDNLEYCTEGGTVAPVAP